MATTTYAVVPWASVTQEMIGLCVENSFDTMRRSLDGTLSILKWVGPKPEILDPWNSYTHLEMLAIVSTPEWQSDD